MELLGGGDSITYDIKKELHPTICDDIKNIKNHRDIFYNADLVIADPPYEDSDFEHYGTKPLNKQKVIRDLGKIMKPNSFLAWLDTRIPMYNKNTWELFGYFALAVSTNTRVRLWSVWKHT